MSDQDLPIPSVLRARGRALWIATTDGVDFDPPDAELLLELCRIFDTIDALATAIATDGVMLVGSQGQPVPNGAVTELRQQQAAAARLTGQLNLDAEETTGIASARVAAGRSNAARLKAPRAVS